MDLTNIEEFVSTEVKLYPLQQAIANGLLLDLRSGCPALLKAGHRSGKSVIASWVASEFAPDHIAVYAPTD